MRSWLLLLLLLPSSLQAAEEILLLKTWQPDQDVSGWLMSEKLDGVRARWDGQHLISRGGHRYHAPAWFTKDFPPFAVDGELWSKRGDFEQILSIVLRQHPHDGWKQLALHVFEVPDQAGGLPERLQRLTNHLTAHPSPYLKIIRQLPCKDNRHLQRFMQQLVARGAEGVVVRNPLAPYQTGRSNGALKVKPYFDQECTVIDYKPGKALPAGQTGSLLCRLDNGVEISIGSGLHQQLRTAPPPQGQRITFKYYGLTAKGVPRHPVFLRPRQDMP
ncbi:DNA ligase [Mariprofundus erugo]|uniref:DNA ligase n=1 Tax=Mariprofundus erugo TaxID=2528639 RepID=A0A5R9GSH7_9PROT|nr:DNA ligase [Mariprofundus erugo]TLS67227.1 DNA ligase [Mariprofundus erugo]